ncbi:MAG: hypothetical protein ACXVPU_06520 [Bacteroidia bacterium]
MKNKKLLYILIPGTILVWGMIFFRVLSTVKTNNDALPQKLSETSESAKMANDTFSLLLNYKDPFRLAEKKTAISENNSKQKNQNTIQKKVIAPVVSTWPKIIFGGVIKNQKSNKELALVQINGQSNIMKAGEISNDVELLKVFKDSIEVKYGKEKKNIKK